MSTGLYFPVLAFGAYVILQGAKYD